MKPVAAQRNGVGSLLMEVGWGRAQVVAGPQERGTPPGIPKLPLRRRTRLPLSSSEKTVFEGESNRLEM